MKGILYLLFGFPFFLFSSAYHAEMHISAKAEDTLDFSLVQKLHFTSEAVDFHPATGNPKKLRITLHHLFSEYRLGDREIRIVDTRNTDDHSVEFAALLHLIEKPFDIDIDLFAEVIRPIRDFRNYEKSVDNRHSFLREDFLLTLCDLLLLPYRLKTHPSEITLQTSFPFGMREKIPVQRNGSLFSFQERKTYTALYPFSSTPAPLTLQGTSRGEGQAEKNELFRLHIRREYEETGTDKTFFDEPLTFTSLVTIDEDPS